MANTLDILRQGRTNSLYDMPLNVIWEVTYHCNYKCSYCSQKSHRPKQRDYMTLPNAKRTLDQLRLLNRSEYNFSFSGGEPTIIPHLLDLLVHIKDIYADKLNCLAIISNGSRNLKLYEGIAKLCESLPFAMIISLHTDHVMLDDIENLINLLSKKAYLHFNLMYNPAKIEYVKEIFSYLCAKRDNYPFELSIETIRDIEKGDIVDTRYLPEHFLWQQQSLQNFSIIKNYSEYKTKWVGKSYTPVSNAIYNNDNYKYEHLIDRNKAYQDGLFYLKGINCVKGTHLIKISPEGFAYSAVCGNAIKSRRPIYDEIPYCTPGFAAVSECKIAACGCRGNDYLMKFKNKNEANDFLIHFKVKQDNLINDYKMQSLLKKELEIKSSLLNNIWNDRLILSKAVDQDFYFKTYPDVAVSGMSAAYHYDKFGWKEGRRPNVWFDTQRYLLLFPNCKESNTNPLLHFICNGGPNLKKC